MTVPYAAAPAPPRPAAADLPGGSTTAALQALVDNVERVITGKRWTVELAVIALASGGHLLIEDVPGVGKTILARALARSVAGEFSRIQGAPDLLPGDITGTSVYDQRRQEFAFVPGPLFANVVLVDELNRTNPRTQAALLEAMEEGQITVDGVTHRLPAPHFVLATQNPIEHHGTFPLPESQLDRFAIATGIGYPTRAEEASIIQAQIVRHPIEDLDAVLDTEAVVRLRRAVREIVVSEDVVTYAVRLVESTRRHGELELGASPRATVQLVHAAQALAAIRGRGHVLPDDLKELAPTVLPHRLIVRRGVGGELPERRTLIADLLRTVPVHGDG